MSDPEREGRLAAVVCAVVERALGDAGARFLFLVDDGSPEADLCTRWLEGALPAGALRRVTPPGAAGLEPPLQRIRPVEAARALARSLAAAGDGLVAGPANRTTLLLAPREAPDDIAPLGDLWASRVALLAGGWSAPPVVAELAARLGGVEHLDRALSAWVDGRPLGVAREDEAQLLAALARARPARRWPRLVPKLEGRTAWIDLGR